MTQRFPTPIVIPLLCRIDNSAETDHLSSLAEADIIVRNVSRVVCMYVTVYDLVSTIVQ